MIHKEAIFEFFLPEFIKITLTFEGSEPSAELIQSILDLNNSFRQHAGEITLHFLADEYMKLPNVRSVSVVHTTNVIDAGIKVTKE